MNNETTGETIAAHLSKKAESTLRDYAGRTGIRFEALAQSIIMEEIGSLSEEGGLFAALPVLRKAPISKREFPLVIHPLVASHLGKAAGIIGISPARLAGLCLYMGALTIGESLDFLDQVRPSDNWERRFFALTYQARAAIELSLMLSLPIPFLGRPSSRGGDFESFSVDLDSTWLEKWEGDEDDPELETPETDRKRERKTGAKSYPLKG